MCFQFVNIMYLILCVFVNVITLIIVIVNFKICYGGNECYSPETDELWCIYDGITYDCQKTKVELILIFASIALQFGANISLCLIIILLNKTRQTLEEEVRKEKV